MKIITEIMPLAQKKKSFQSFVKVRMLIVRFVYADFNTIRTLVVLGSSQINEHSCQPH